MPPDLLALFMAARLGNETSLTELVTHLVVPLRRFAYSRLHNWHDAEEVMQATQLGLVRIVRNTRRSYSFADEGRFLAYVFRIVRNQIRWLRQRQGRSRREDDPFGEVLLNLFDPVEPSADCEAVREVVADLPPADQELFELYVQEYTSVEIGDLLGGTNHHTVRYWWRRVCQRLRDALPDLVLKYR